MTILEQFLAKGVKGLVDGVAQQKVLCPQCSPSRKKSSEPCLSVNLEQGVCHCHNCGWASGVNGGAKVTEHYTRKDYDIPKYNPESWELTEEVIDYFKNRGISKGTLESNRVGGSEGIFFRGREPEPIISFPYIKDKIVNVKYRTFEKDFKLVKNAETCLYGIQNLFEDEQLATKKIFITEGEIDALSLYECGFKYALSVPSGAAVEEEGLKPITPKLEYLEDPDMIKVFQGVSEIVLVCDADYKGQRLRDELALRFGIKKCYSVKYPDDCKDINDVLVKYGKDKVIEVILDYKPMLEGMVTVSSLNDKLLSYYQEGTEGGMMCGIEPLDSIFTTQHSQVIIVTGTPESMKSVFMDNLSSGLGLNYDVHTCIYSPESRPVEMHIGRLASIHNGYFLGTPEDVDRMPYQEYVESCKWINKHFTFIQPPNNTLGEILQLWEVSLTQYGSKIFILDPYSKINWEGENEHQFIRKMLNELGEFANRNRVTVFLVAHPKKMELQRGAKGQQADYRIVQPYDIAGSSSFYNSSDIILSLWKSKVHEFSPLKVYIQKSKLHHIAKSGKMCELEYNFDNWRLGESEEPVELSEKDIESEN